LALIVSLLSFSISLYFGLRDRVHLRATSKLYNLSGEFGPAYIEVKVVNRGRRPAILTMFGGELDNGKWLGTYLGEKGRGIRLEENEYHIEKVSFSDLEQFDAVKEEVHEYIRLWFEDSLGRRHPVKKSKRNIQLLKKV
jgi:hypothetical protein